MGKRHRDYNQTNDDDGEFVVVNDENPRGDSVSESDESDQDKIVVVRTNLPIHRPKKRYKSWMSGSGFFIISVLAALSALGFTIFLIVYMTTSSSSETGDGPKEEVIGHCPTWERIGQDDNSFSGRQSSWSHDIENGPEGSYSERLEACQEECFNRGAECFGFSIYGSYSGSCLMLQEANYEVQSRSSFQAWKKDGCDATKETPVDCLDCARDVVNAKLCSQVSDNTFDPTSGNLPKSCMSADPLSSPCQTEIADVCFSESNPCPNECEESWIGDDHCDSPTCDDCEHFTTNGIFDAGDCDTTKDTEPVDVSDPCDPNPCANGSSCRVNGEIVKCTCSEGFRGTFCESIEDPCTPDPCQNGGTCRDNGFGAAICTCTVGWLGLLCQTYDDPCTPNPCKNDGTCTDNGQQSFSCACRTAYTGQRCQTYDDPCASNPCLNDGVCEDNDGVSACACNSFFTGELCEIEIDYPDFALISGAPGPSRPAEPTDPDPGVELGKVQCCRDGNQECTRRNPSDSISGDDCISGDDDPLLLFTLQAALDACAALGSEWTLCSRSAVNDHRLCQGMGCSIDSKLVWILDPASEQPSVFPTLRPTTTAGPTRRPTTSQKPTRIPTTTDPSFNPTNMPTTTLEPSRLPTEQQSLDCEGNWSACTVECETGEQRTFTETQAREGNGAECPEAIDCQFGDGDCQEDLDCEGTWSECTAACETKEDRIFTQTQQQSGNGESCPSYAEDCQAGMDECSHSEPIFPRIDDQRFAGVFPVFPGEDSSKVLYFSVVDIYTRTQRNYLGNSKSHRVTYDDIWAKYDDQYDDARFVVVCDTVINESPCDKDDYWRSNTKWLWLSSEQLCDLSSAELSDTDQIPFPEPETSNIQAKRCPGKVDIDTLVVDEIEPDVTRALHQMMMDLDNKFPGELNQNGMLAVRKTYDAYINGNDLKITVNGESVAAKIGMNWKDHLHLDVTEQPGDWYPDPVVFNLGRTGHVAISYYLCPIESDIYYWSRCDEFDNPAIADEVLRSYEDTTPHVAVVHDQHFPFDGENKGDNMDLDSDRDRVLAFNEILKDAKENGVQSFNYMTMSSSDNPTNRIHPADYWTELNIFLQVVDMLQCDEGDANGLYLNLIDWAFLTCPTLFSTGLCPDSAHGFDKILPDGTHPDGSSGRWLTRTMLAVVTALASIQVLDHEKYEAYQTFEEALENPISRSVLDITGVDNDPPLNELYASFYVCPYSEISTLDEDYQATSFPSWERYRDSQYLLSLY